MAIQAHARLQGTMMDFGKKVSPLFALIYSLIVYAISIALPSPRTASVTYEMAIQPYFELFLTPAIILLLGSIICIGLFGNDEPLRASTFNHNFTGGLLEGYQTFDAIGAGLGFLIIYTGLIALGAANSGTLDVANRTDLLGQLSLNTLGSMGRAALGILVALACFTTAVGIVAGTADFFKGLFKDSQNAYVITAVIHNNRFNFTQCDP